MEIVKLKYDPWGRKFFIKQPDDREKDFHENDEPFDFRVRPKRELKPPPKRGSIEEEIMQRNATKVSKTDNRLPQIHIKEHGFSGHPKLDITKETNEFNYNPRGRGVLPSERTPQKPREFRLKMPHIPEHCKESLGIDFTEFLWGQFVDHGVNKFGLLMYKHISYIKKMIAETFGEVCFES